MFMLALSGTVALSCTAVAVMPEPDRLNTKDLGTDPACSMLAVLLLFVVFLSRLIAAV